MDKYFEILKFEEGILVFKGTVASFNLVINNTEKLLNGVFAQANMPQSDFYMTSPIVSFDISNPADCHIDVAAEQIVFPKYQNDNSTFKLSLYIYSLLRNTLHEIENQLRDVNNAFNVMVTVTLSNFNGDFHLEVEYDHDFSKEKDLTFYPYRLIDNSEVYHS